VVYDNYFGTGTRLIYTPTLDGVKEDIVLTAYRGVSSFTFLLNTGGLRVFRTAEDRWYLAEYEEAELRFWLGNVEVYDANLKPSLGIMTVEPIAEGQRYRLTISADPNFLTDPATAYPVTIDPTITVSDNANGAGAIEDAPIYEGYPNRNFGSYIYDRAGYGGATYKRGRTLFRLTGLTSNSTYSSLAASKLISVYFYVTEATGTTNARVNLHPLTSNTSWTEAGVTWNTVGAYSTSVSSTNLGGGNCSYFDITSLAKAWKTGSLSASAGFILIGANESSVDKSLCSSEYTTASKQPYVVATYYVCGIRLGDVPTNLRSNAIHACIPCAITNVAAYWSISEYPQFNCSTATQQETAAINVQSAMSAAGSYTANANISAGFSIFSHTSGSVTYRLQATNCWRRNNAFTFTDIVQEIDNGRPLLVGFAGTADSPFAEPHMTACAGYNISGANYYLYISDAHKATIQLYPFNISTYNDFISKVTVVQSQ
jgi:hypothetical protein